MKKKNKSKQVNVDSDDRSGCHAPLIANMEDLIGILLVVLISGTQTMDKATTQLRDTGRENGPGKTTNTYFILIVKISETKLDDFYH